MSGQLRRWTVDDEVALIRDRRDGKCAKQIARRLNRTPQAVGTHVGRMKEIGRLAQHRAEELALMERLLAEYEMPERYPER